MQQPPNDPDWQQPQQPQQPNTQYPPQQPQWQLPPPPPPNAYYPPQYQPPSYQQYPLPPPPKKRSHVWLWIVLGVLAVVVLGCIGVVALATSATKTTTSTLATTVATTALTPAPTTKASTPQGQQKWTTTHSFSGSSSKKTPFFTVPDDWRINWTCHGGEFGGNLSVTVYGTGNAYVDLPVNASCPAGKTVSDTTEEHQGGSIYLDIEALSDWTIQIQELK